MKIFPNKELKFKLIDDQAKTLDRLNRRTEKSTMLISRFTDKLFRGTINENNFKIISTTIGKGAFCVMSGTIESETGTVKVEINKAFKILFIILFIFILLAFTVGIITNKDDFSPSMILAFIVYLLIFRYAFIGLYFKFLSQESLKKLQGVLDVEWIKS